MSTDTVDPVAVRRANLRLLLGMIAFAVGLAALCIVWMHYHSERLYEEQIGAPTSLAAPARRSPFAGVGLVRSGC